MAREPRRLAIVGASVRAAAQSAVKAGYEVVAADLFADADLRALCHAARIADYPHGLADWLAEQSVDAWLFTGALENYPGLVERMQQVLPLLGCGADSLKLCRDPASLDQNLRPTGVAFPQTVPWHEAPRGEPGWLAKTYQHSAGAGVWALETESDFRRAESSHAWAQRFVRGAPMSAVYAVSRDGAALLGVSRQLVGAPLAHAPRWAYCGSVAPADVGPSVLEKLEELGKLLSASLGLLGLVGVDLVVDDNEVTLIEINPRFPASVEVLERAYQQSAVEAHARACRGESIDAWIASEPMPSAKLILYAERDTIVSNAFSDWAWEQHRAGRMADLPSPGETISAARPVCTLFAGDYQGLAEMARETESRLYPE